MKKTVFSHLYIKDLGALSLPQHIAYFYQAEVVHIVEMWDQFGMYRSVYDNLTALLYFILWLPMFIFSPLICLYDRKKYKKYLGSKENWYWSRQTVYFMDKSSFPSSESSVQSRNYK